MKINFTHRVVRAHAPWMTALAAAVMVAISLAFYPIAASAAPAPVGLGTAANFSVLAGSTVTNTGLTTLGQSLGLHPGSSITGFPPGIVGGGIHIANGVAL